MIALCVLVILSLGRLACAQSNDAQKLNALKQALKAGVLSQEEYDAKLAQIKGEGLDPAKKAAKTNSPSGPTKTVAVVDNVMNMPAFRVTVPADWTFDGAVLRSECGDGIPFLTYRAYSPDKFSGIQLLPQVDWYSAADPRAYRSAGISPCHLHAPARATDVAAKIATDVHPGSQVLEMPPLTQVQSDNFHKALDQGRSQIEQMNRQFPPNFRGTWDLDMARVKVCYDFEGRAVEEMLTIVTTIWGNPVSMASTGPNGIIQPGIARLFHTSVKVSAIRALAGKLEATITALEKNSAVQMVPEWDEAEIALIKRQGAEVLASIQRNGQLLRDQADQFARNMQASNDRYHAWQQQRRAATEQKFAEDMQRKNSQAQNFLDYVKDQTYYVNPSTGETMTIKNQQGVSGYVGQTPSGGWSQLVPINH